MIRSLLALALLAGCGDGRLDEIYPLGTSTITSSRSGDALYAVNTVDGTISQVNVETGASFELPVGLEPTRIARLSDDRLAVTLRGERAVAIVDISGTKPVLQRKVQVGAEPFGIVASQDGAVVYVALSQQNEVIELDGTDLRALRSWSVDSDPRWLALHPSGDALFVARAYGARLVRIDLTRDRDGGSVIDLPEISRETQNAGFYPLTPRITGDITISPFGDVLLVPGLYVDNESGPSADLTGQGVQVPYYASSSVGISRMNPALVAFRLDGTGELTNLAPLPVPLIGEVEKEGRIFQTVRSYPSSVVMAPNGKQAIVTMEGSDVLVGVQIAPSRGQGSRASTLASNSDPELGTDGDLFTGVVEGGFYQRAVRHFETAAGPIGLAFLPDGEAFVHHHLDRSIGSLDLSGLEAVVDNLASSSSLSSSVPFGTQRIQVKRDFKDIAQSTLTPTEDAGRRLFYSAINSEMSADGAGVSCSTCHFDGRNDGLTWTFEFGPRQTPSLAGVVSETEPVSWTFDVESTAAEALITSRDRMGGGGLSVVDAEALGAWVDRTVEVDVPDKGLENDEVALGRDIFERSEVGCSECHSGPRFTDNKNHDLYGLDGVNTPTLVGIAATAPYLHDGSAPTLRSLLERLRDGSMGDTSSLDGLELDALERYLGSL